jgi:hypothetical protein
MKLPKHTCIGCAYLCESGKAIIPFHYREQALDGKTWNHGNINYERIICHMDKRDYSKLNQRKQVIDIRNGVIEPYKCTDWTKFTGFTPAAEEQRKSSKWAKWAFWVALASLVAVLVTWILSQFVFN